MVTRVADYEWLSAPVDSPANVRWEGLISAEGISTLAQISLQMRSCAAIQTRHYPAAPIGCA